MQPLPFATVQSTPNKQQVSCIQGVIAAVFPMENGTGQFGPYTRQKVMLKEPQTGMQLRATIYDADPFNPADIGQALTLTLGQNSKGLWVGLAADHYTSNSGQVIYGVRAGRGGMMYLNGQPRQSHAPVPSQFAPQPHQPIAGWPSPPPTTGWPPQPQPQPIQNPPRFPMPEAMQQHPPIGFVPPSPGSQPVPQMLSGAPTPPYTQAPQQVERVSPVVFLASQTAGYIMCFEAALRVRSALQTQLETGPGEPISTTDVKDIATTFYIEGNKRGIFATLTAADLPEHHDEGGEGVGEVKGPF